ncbi:hypothetical protein HVTV-2_gp141 [Haloarcula virus HVTV-2]|uniref:Uncharacterized protein n=1 Tax=Haloarcula vallismortis tailed virus 1 TaxID=1262528 RepID=L7TH16_9CAUD|nr:hypothetical protein HVTV1_140 [Haloarcula vallismortis tailed virus 1]AGC34509.1 hypothetical protein HVTV1_140 [Haloarcula vallismortis tailed virus 1]UBF22948.1 hypothetical protein HVTV-2_gp141 [Haloarcula virus HVTV-2]
MTRRRMAGLTHTDGGGARFLSILSAKVRLRYPRDAIPDWTIKDWF